jgi:hypothetical protein
LTQIWKVKQAKKDLKPFFIIVGAILAIGTVNIVIVKKSIIIIETTNIRKKEKICQNDIVNIDKECTL